MESGNQWSHLLKDLLVVIVKRLKNRVFVLRLLAVCKPWRSSILSFLEEEQLQYSPLKLPLMFPPDYPTNEISGGYITVSESRVYCLEPSQQNPNASIVGNPPSSSPSSSSSLKGILVEVEEEKPDKVRRLPYLSFLKERWHKKFAKELNLLELQFSEISKVYKTKSDTMFDNDGSMLWLPHIKKVAVLSSNPMRAIADSHVLIMAIFTPGRLCFLKSGEEKWTAIDEQRSDYRDVIQYKGKFYAVSSNGSAIVVDSFLNVTKIASSIQGHHVGHPKYLVNSLADMLLVDLPTKVYKLDEAKRKWVEMTSLGDRVLYVDEHCTFSVSSREVTGCKGSCIYHASSYLWLHREVFNLEDGEWQDLDECFLGVSLEGVGGLSLSLDVSHVPGLSWALVDAELSTKERAVDTPIGKKKKKKEKEEERKNTGNGGRLHQLLLASGHPSLCLRDGVMLAAIATDNSSPKMTWTHFRFINQASISHVTVRV